MQKRVRTRAWAGYTVALEIQAGRQTITAADLPSDLQEALEAINRDN